MRPVVILLAGGLSRRMGGGDKCLRVLGGRPLLRHVIDRMAPQSETLVLNANGDPGRFAAFGLPVVGDAVPDRPGPLAGILSGMLWAQSNLRAASDVVTVPADSPFLPDDLVDRLLDARARSDARVACAASGGRLHPVIGLWRVELSASLRQALAAGTRKVQDWVSQQDLAVARYATDAIDPFFNANTPLDLAEAEQLLAASTAGHSRILT